MTAQSRKSSLDRSKALLRLVNHPAVSRVSEAERVVVANRRLIRKAMRMGHSLETISRELGMPKRTLRRHLNRAGLFFRKPRAQKGRAVKRNRTAILRAKRAMLSNV